MRGNAVGGPGDVPGKAASAYLAIIVRCVVYVVL
jgi:hypothetical protein